MIAVTESIERLRYLCEIIPPLLKQINDAEFLSKPSPEKWSKKEILGHLIDSAANNHHRFIRIQYEKEPLKGVGGDGKRFPFHFYIKDYVDHLEHHLHQIVSY